MFRSNLTMLIFGFLILSVLMPQKMIVHAAVSQCLDNILTGNLNGNAANTVLQQSPCPSGNQDMCIKLVFSNGFVRAGCFGSSTQIGNLYTGIPSNTPVTSSILCVNNLCNGASFASTDKLVLFLSILFGAYLSK